MSELSEHELGRKKEKITKVKDGLLIEVREVLEESKRPATGR